MKLSIPVRSAHNGQVSAERLVNCYAEQASGKTDVQIISTPGLSLFATTGSGHGRGLFTHNNELYTVVGAVLYKVTAGGAAIPQGSIYGSGICQFVSSGDQMGIAADGTGYVYNGTLSEISDPDFLGCDSIAYLDGYFIFGNGTESFSISQLYDGGNIDALDFASAESNPDVIVRPFVDHRELLLFGKETVETWVNTGDSDFPFERVSGGITEKGLAGRNAIARIDNTVFWLDNDGVVRRMADGYSPQRISTHEVERTLSSYSDAECFAYVANGHEFFVLSLPSITWVFDASTQLWHERKSETRWRARGYAYCYGKHLVGDFESGNIYELNEETYTENGEDLVTEFVFPVVHNEGDRFRLHRVVLDMEVGEADDPIVRLDLSDDGRVWRTAGRETLGAIGNRKKRIVFRRLGQHTYLHMKFIISDPCKRALYSAHAEVSRDF